MKNTQDGTPSPNPSYPSPVNVVKGDNEVVVENKNWFDKDNTNVLTAYVGGTGTITQSGNDRGIWIPVRQNTTYTIKFTQIALSTSTARDDTQVGIYPSQPEIGSVGTRAYNYQRPSATADYTYTITVNTGTNNFVFVKIAQIERTNYAETLKTLQIEIGSTATDYVPHAEQVYPISLGSIELAKIGSYQDKLFKAIEGDTVYDSLSSTQKEGLTSGSWYKLANIGKTILNGSEEGWGTSGTSTSGYNRFATAFLNSLVLKPSSSSDVAKAISDKFVITNANQNYSRTNGICFNSSGTLYLYYDNIATYTVNNFKTWLSNNNTTVYYVLATPTFTEITDTTLITQLENWRNSKSYQGQTNISQTNDDKAFVISYTTLKDVYSELDSRLKALEG